MLSDFHYWWSEELCSQQHRSKLLELVTYWDPCKGSVTDWRFAHQRKEGYYKIKFNWVLKRKFNCKLVFWNRQRWLVRFLILVIILVTALLLISGFLGVVKITRWGFCLARGFPHLSTNHCVNLFSIVCS